jgi:predicted transcriptional regulator
MIFRRSQAQIYLDILTSVQRKNGKIKKTHIMYNANLTHDRLEKHLKVLLLNNFLEKSNVKNETFYTITKKGYDFLMEIRRLKKMSEAFGIPV